MEMVANGKSKKKKIETRDKKQEERFKIFLLVSCFFHL